MEPRYDGQMPLEEDYTTQTMGGAYQLFYIGLCPPRGRAGAGLKRDRARALQTEPYSGVRLSFARLCQLAGRLENGAPFIIGLVQIMKPPEYPCMLYPFVLAVELEIEPMEAGGRLTMEVLLIDEDAKTVLKIEHGATLPTAPHRWPGRYWVTFQIPAEIAVPGPGAYRFDVYANGHLLGGERLILAEREG